MPDSGEGPAGLAIVVVLMLAAASTLVASAVPVGRNIGKRV